VPRRTQTKGARKRDAIARSEAERELRDLAMELRATWREQPGEDSAGDADPIADNE